MRILALTKYGTLAAGTRQRFLQYAPALADAGIELEVMPLLDNDYLAPRLSGRGSRSVLPQLRAYGRRLGQLLTRRDHDVLWVHLELFPYLPGIFERLAALGGKPIVYDHDDAIFHQYDAHPRAAVRRLLGGKLERLLRRAAAATCGNPYLQEYAARFCPNSIVLPTVVDANLYTPAPSRPDAGPPMVGWIGSPSTWPYVRPLLPVLTRLARDGAIRFRAIGAGERAVVDGPGLAFLPWREEEEVARVRAMDIGIMPVPDDAWARGKSGYKLIQYMACGVPTVASPVGVNSEIVSDGVTGRLASSETQWEAALTALAGDPALRARMGAAGRERFERRYSLQVNAPRLVALMRSLA